MERETGFEPATSTLAIPPIMFMLLIIHDLQAQKYDNTRKIERKFAPQAHPDVMLFFMQRPIRLNAVVLAEIDAALPEILRGEILDSWRKRMS